MGQKMKIVGILGKQQSGKTSAADYLLQRNPEALILGFSHSLKELYSLVFCQGGFSAEDFDSQKLKETMHIYGKTHRQMLIEFGIKMREIDPEIWVREWRQQISHHAKRLIIVPDIRFPNEIKAIQNLGGICLRLIRNPLLITDVCDIAADGASFDLNIDNTQLDMDQTNQLVERTVNAYFYKDK